MSHDTRRRVQLLDRIGQIQIRNLTLSEGPLRLLNVVCEVWIGEYITFRSGVCKDTMNPMWTLQNATQAEFQEIEERFDILNETIRIRILKIPMNMNIDSFPHHHTTPFPNNCEVVVEYQFNIKVDLQPLEIALSEINASDKNICFIGIHEKTGSLQMYKLKPGCNNQQDDESSKQTYSPEQIQAVIELLSKVDTLSRARKEKEESMRKALEVKIASTRQQFEDFRESSYRKKLEKTKQTLIKERDALHTKAQRYKELIQSRNDTLKYALDQFESKQDNKNKTEELEQLKMMVYKESILVRAHRVSLLRAVLDIYPLQERYTEKGEWLYAVRGITIPSNFVNVEEDQVSTALGYLAHLVYLVSKYLDVPLRYVPLPRSSNSTICDPVVICRETPHQPLGRQQATANPSCPPHIFGYASGRLARATARKSLHAGTYPLHLRGIPKAQRPRCEYAFELLGRDSALLLHIQQYTSHSSTSPSQADISRMHIVTMLRQLLDDY